jgi:hypothetical protein
LDFRLLGPPFRQLVERAQDFTVVIQEREIQLKAKTLGLEE